MVQALEAGASAVKPDYHGGSIVNLMASLQVGLGGAPPAYRPAPALHPALVAAARGVVLFIIDGLGYDYLRAHPQAVHLNRALRSALTSVFPSTTASAVTTFLTGDAPQQHAVTGWHMYMRELGAVMTVLPGQPRFGGAALQATGVDLTALLGHRAFSTRIAVPAHMVMPAHIAHSAYSIGHSGESRIHPYRGLAGLFEQVTALLAADESCYVHAYWPDLDAAGHGAGMGSREALACLLDLDARFGQMLQALRGSGALVLLCADHGQVDTRSATWLDLEAGTAAGDELLLPLCGEPRAAYCYPRGGRAGSFAAALATRFPGRYRLLRSAEWVAAGWFGLGPAHAELASRVGELLLLPGAHGAVKDRLPGETRLRVVGVHGGTSRAEMLVPLVVARP